MGADAPGFAPGIFFGQQAVQGFQGGELLAFHLVEDAIEDFQGSGHLQVHQVLFDRLQGADGADKELSPLSQVGFVWDGILE